MCLAVFFLPHLMDLLADNRLCHKTTYHGPSVDVSRNVYCIVQAENVRSKMFEDNFKERYVVSLPHNESFEIIFMIR